MAQEALDHPVHRVGGPGQELVEVAAQWLHPTRGLLPLPRPVRNRLTTRLDGPGGPLGRPISRA
jgi:hypothetical protein